MQKLEAQLKAKNFEEVEKTADSILKMIGSRPAPDVPGVAAVRPVLSLDEGRVDRSADPRQAQGHHHRRHRPKTTLPNSWGFWRDLDFDFLDRCNEIGTLCFRVGTPRSA